MLTLGTHKIYKITSLTTDSYKQLFVLITMLLTVLSVQQSSTTFAMAAPMQQPSPAPPSAAQQHNLLQHHPPPRPHHRHPHHPQQRGGQDGQQHQQPQQHAQHPETQLNSLLATNDDNHHHQSETDIETEERLLHKRHTSWHAYYAETMNSKKIEWYNPCGGLYVNVNPKQKPKSKPAVKKTLRNLQNATAREYYSLMANELNAIDIRNMSVWKKFDEDYKFLPKMKLTSDVSLRRWYRQIQIYVAAFDYLHRAQLRWDYNKAMQRGTTASELYLLRNSARDILCNIENAINNRTMPSKAKKTIDSLLIPREEMETKLRFYTDIRHISPLNWDQTREDKTSYHINPVDLRFAKSRFLRYVWNFIKFLRVTTKRPGPIQMGGKPKKKQRGQQQQQSPAQQQQLQNKPQKSSKRRKTKATSANLE